VDYRKLAEILTSRDGGCLVGGLRAPVVTKRSIYTPSRAVASIMGSGDEGGSVDPQESERIFVTVVKVF